MTNFKYFLLSIISLFFSLSLSAEDLTTSLNVNCESSISAFSLISSADDENKDEKIFESSKDIISSCGNDIFVYNLTNKLLFYFYGDSVKFILEKISYLFEKDNERIDKFFDSDINNAPLSTIVKTVATTINIIAIILIFVIYTKSIIKNIEISSSGKSFTPNMGKNLVKILIGFSILLPLDSLNGFSLIQSIIILSLIIAGFIGNTVWLIIVFALELSTISDIKNSSLEEYRQTNAYTESKQSVASDIIKNINSHLCDIRTIEIAIEGSINNLKTKEDLENNEIYKCLHEIDNGKLKYLDRSEKCLKDNNLLYSKSSSYCGNFKESDNDKINEYRNYLGLYENHQTELREIALIIHNDLCKKYNSSNTDTQFLKFECIEQNINYEYEFDNDKKVFKNIQKIEDYEFNIENMTTKINNAIDNSFQKMIEKIMIDYLSENNSQSEKLKNSVVSSIRNGWLGSNSLYFTSTMFSTLELDNFKISNEIYTYDSSYNPLYFLGNEKSYKSASDVTQMYLKEKETKDILKNLQDSVYNKSNNETDAVNSLSIYSLMNLTKNNSYDCFIAREEDGECSTTNLNPFYKLVKEGLNMSNVSLPVILSYEITSIFLNKKSDYHLINNLKTVFKATAIVGLFLGYFLPMIPFFIFISRIISWLVDSFKSLIAIQYSGMLFIIPDNNEDFEGLEINVYKMIINIIIQPFLIVLGLLVSFIMIHISIGLTNATFSIIVSFLNIPYEASGFMYYIENAIAVIIYLIIITLLIIKSSQAINEIPNTVSEWFHLDVGNEHDLFKSLKNVGEKIIFMKV